jgi:uncharacterized protein YegL
VSTNYPEDPEGPFAPPATRSLPTVLCLDISGSMAFDGKIERLKSGLEHFVRSIRAHALASRCVKWEFITFGGDVTDHLGWMVPANDTEDDALNVVVPKLVAGGNTPLAEAVELGLVTLEAAVKDLKQEGTRYHRPWLVVMTDGRPNPSPKLPEVLAEVQRKLNQGQLVVIAIGVGEDADEEFLNTLSPQRKPDMINDDDIERLFDHLSDQMIAASSGVPGADGDDIAPLEQ